MSALHTITLNFLVYFALYGDNNMQHNLPLSVIYCQLIKQA